MESVIILSLVGIAAAVFIILKVKKSLKKDDCGSCCSSCPKAAKSKKI